MISEPPYLDRIDAGRQLAARLLHLAGHEKLIVLGLPRGGVPVAAQVAALLHAPLDVFVVRKLGVPGREELAMGAVASGGLRVINSEIVMALGISDRTVDDVTEVEQRELVRRERAYRGNRPRADLAGATIVLVDDGVATGSTMLAAIRALRQERPAMLIAAAPVMSLEALASLEREADACVTLATPEPFHGVGAWYEDFSQTSDEEVITILEEAAARIAARTPAPSP